MIPPAPPDDRLPDGFVVRLDPRVRRRRRTAPCSAARRCGCCGSRARARALLRGDRLVVRDATHRRARRPAAGRRARRPRPARPRAPDDVTVVIPVRDRPGRARPPARRRCAPTRRPRDLPVVVVDDGSAPPVRGRPASGVLRHAGRPRPGRRAQRRAAGGDHRRSSPSWTPTACPRPGWLERLRPHLADPRLGAGGARGSSRSTAARRLARRATRPRSARWTWARSRPPVRPLSAVSYVPSAALLARRDGARRRVRRVDAGRRGRRPGLAAGRGRVAGALRAGAPRSRTSTPPGRRPGCGGGPSTAPVPRCWPRGTARAVAPLVLAPESAAGLGAGARRRTPGPRRRRPGCSRVDRRPAGPPAGPPRRAACPWRSPPGWSLRGHGAVRAGAGPRGHPAPLAGRAGRRRWSRAGRGARCWPSRSPTPSLAWWPQRAAGGTGPFRRRPAAGGPRLRRRPVVGRRPRPRHPRALLPARPPRDPRPEDDREPECAGRRDLSPGVLRFEPASAPATTPTARGAP